MKEHRDQVSTSPNGPQGRRSGMATLAIAVIALLIVSRVAVEVFSDRPTPDLAYQSPTETPIRPTAVPSSTQTSLPSATATDAPPTATRTPIPTATPVPVRLAVQQGVYDSYQTFFSSLAPRYAGLVVLPYPRNAPIDDALAMQTSDATIHWAAQEPEQGYLLCEQPYALVAHSLFPRGDLNLAQVKALASGQDQTYIPVVGDGGAIARELLGLESLADQTVYADGWVAAREYVATHEGTWALLPWEAVNFRVRTLTVEGRRLDPRSLAGYPLMRRLWVQDSANLPRPLLDDLREALHYVPQATVELAAVGDVMLGRLVGERMAQKSYTYPFEGEGIQPILTGADLTFANLECPISDGGVRQDKGYAFRADPKAIEGLTYAGFDVLSLANNHTGDYADYALTQTLSLLTESNLVAVGAGHTITEAHEAKIVMFDGLSLAFLAYNQIAPNWFEATTDSPGSAFMQPDKMAADVQAARQQADVVIVSCHWGVEYTPYPNASQQALAKTLADAGAALVIGHHPHVLQGIRYETNTLITYSLGNFVFDQGLSEQTEQGVILRALIDVSGVKAFELIPVLEVRSQPKVLSPEQGAPVLERIMKVTREQKALPK